VRWLFAFALFAACRGSAVGPSTEVLALAGDVEFEAGATVLTTAVDGTPIDRQITDGSGHISLAYDPGALVTVIFFRNGAYQLITTPALATDTLVIHGPPAAKAPIIAGAVAITGATITADAISIQLGCTTINVAHLPTTVDVLATCFGTDSSVDMLVRATAAGSLVGYSASRVPIVDEVGMLDIPAWSTMPIAVPITENDTGAAITLDEVSDTFPFATPPADADSVYAWTGLVADRSLAHATLGDAHTGQTTTQYLAGLPTSIAFTTSDFLPQATTQLSRAQLAFTWTAFSVGDLVNLHATWPNVTWDAVLALGSTQVAFPTLDSDLAQLIMPPVDGTGLTTTLRAVDGPDTINFADVQAAGLYLETTTGATIVPPPTAGELLETHVD
jgi:hypothetical protein